MTPQDLQDLQSLTGALHRVEQARMRAILQEESDLRHLLAQLDEDARQIQNLPEAQSTDLRTIGGDVTWQAWVAKTRRNLNVQLAQVLARKGIALTALERTFGRDEAVGNIVRDTVRDRRDVMEKTRIEQQQSLFCFQPALNQTEKS